MLVFLSLTDLNVGGHQNGHSKVDGLLTISRILSDHSSKPSLATYELSDQGSHCIRVLADAKMLYISKEFERRRKGKVEI